MCLDVLTILCFFRVFRLSRLEIEPSFLYSSIVLCRFCCQQWQMSLASLWQVSFCWGPFRIGNWFCLVHISRNWRFQRASCHSSKLAFHSHLSLRRCSMLHLIGKVCGRSSLSAHPYADMFTLVYRALFTWSALVCQAYSLHDVTVCTFKFFHFSEGQRLLRPEACSLLIVNYIAFFWRWKGNWFSFFSVIVCSCLNFNLAKVEDLPA